MAAKYYIDPTAKLVNDFWSGMNATVLMLAENRRRRACRNRTVWQSKYRAMAIARRQRGTAGMKDVAKRFNKLEVLYVAKACAVAKAKRGGNLSVARALHIITNLRAA